MPNESERATINIWIGLVAWSDVNRNSICLHVGSQLQIPIRMMKTILLAVIVTQVFGRSVDDSTRSSATTGKKLEKRVIYPGTLWCGMGNKAENDDQLGSYADVDSCCRSHDKCDRKVRAFAKDYGYRNWRPFTVSDCECDKDFHDCLKEADEHPKAAKIVGSLFFNILKMPCLRFNAFGTQATKGHSPSYK